MNLRKYGIGLAVGAALVGGIALSAVTVGAQDPDDETHVVVVEGTDGKECIVEVDTIDFGIEAECEEPTPTPSPTPKPTASPSPSPTPTPIP